MNLKLFQQAILEALRALGTRAGTELRALISSLSGNGGAGMIGTSSGQTLQQRLDAIGNGGGEGGEGIPPGTLEQIAADKQAVAEDRTAVATAKGQVDTAKSAVDTAKSAVDTAKGQVDTVKGQIDTIKSTIDGQASSIATAVNTTLPGLVAQATAARDAAGTAGASAGATTGASAGASAASAAISNLAQNTGANNIGTSNGQTVEERLSNLEQNTGGGSGEVVPLPVQGLFDSGHVNLGDLVPNAFHRIEGSGGTQITIYDEGDSSNGYSMPENAEWHLRNAADTAITIENAGSIVSLSGNAGPVLVLTVAPWASVVIKRVSQDNYDVIGNAS